MSKPVSILYGLAEGSQIGRGLIAVLEANGYKVTDHAKAVIAHSGGIYLLSEEAEYDQVLIVAPSIGRLGEPVVVTQANKTARDLAYALRHQRLLQCIDKLLWNVVYLVSHISTNRHLAAQHRRYQPSLPTIKARRIIVIAYENDPWSKSLIATPALPANYQLIVLPYVHDDLWYNPQRYLDYLADRP